MKTKEQKNNGFTLIEMLVAMTLFSFVITIALGSLFAILKANEKAKIMKTVVNNLNVALEGMSREIRVGSKYDKDNNGCSLDAGCSIFTFKTKEDCDGAYKVVLDGNIYRLQRKIKKKSDPTSTCDIGDSGFVNLTGSDINIVNSGGNGSGLSFHLTGTGAGDLQPRVFVLLRGEIKRASLQYPEILNIQTTISQRKIKN